jgi:hypothetical protein
MNIFSVTIPDSPSALLITYGAGALIRVQSSPTEAGVYGDVVTIPIVAGVSTYAVYDSTSAFTDWYRIRYEAEDGTPAGSYSAAFQPMPIDGIYASLSDFKNFVRSNGADTTDDTLMVMALDAAARAIDRTCNRTFVVSSGVETARVFTPLLMGNRYVLPVDDMPLSATPTVMFDSTTNGLYDTASTGFRLGPTTAAARGLPYTLLNWNSGVTPPPLHDDSVEVTAAWGWDAVPTTITYASMLQASRFLKRRDAPFGVTGSGELGNEMRLLAKVDPDVAVMVGAYRRWWGAV